MSIKNNKNNKNNKNSKTNKNNKRVDTYSHYKKDDKKLDKKIKELKENNRKVNATIGSQDEDSSKVEGRNAVIELLKSNREINKIFIAKGERQGSINDIIKLCKDKGIVFQEVDKAKLDELTETNHHQGVIAFASPIEYKEISDILEIAKKRNEDPFIVICDEIEDPHNLGALIRTAEIAGCHGLIIPKRRSCQVTEVVSKVSCGATEHLAIARVGNINDAIEELKQAGVWIYGTDGSAKKLYYEEDLTGPIAIIIGSEGRGMNKLVMKNCDVLLKIPMKGHITSLNASVSGGIVIFEAVRQRLLKK
ncbi:MAG: 23S rRNA (guanosine(2251)-2'-O)-methyltransferase RlmB [Clostridia bacterium]|nr:23S rRNA (guanosine(2251)-2'-O)-methyltransferase RlmB [Clostridia bacterium]